MKIKTKIILLVSSLLLGVAISNFISISINLNSSFQEQANSFKKTLMQRHKDQLRNLVESAQKIIASTKKQYSNDDVAKEKAARIISSMLYQQGKNYLYIIDSKANIVSHINKKIVGKNFWKVKDKKGNLLFQDIIRAAMENQKGGFSRYW